MTNNTTLIRPGFLTRLMLSTRWFLKELLRLKLELSLLVLSFALLWLAGIVRQAASELLYKELLMSVAVLQAHVCRSLLFWYVDLYSLIYSRSRGDVPMRAAAIRGIFTFYAAYVVGFALIA